MTTSDDLVQVNSAIAAIENGCQEYRIGHRSLKRADLATLYRERGVLQQKLNMENGNNVSVAVFNGR